jgi:hypothetical protein
VKKPVPDGKDQGCLDNWEVSTDCEGWYTNQGEVPISRPGPAAESVKMLLRAKLENGFEELLEKPGDFSVV